MAKTSNDPSEKKHSFLLLIAISSIKNFVKPLVINPKSSCCPVCHSLTYFSWDDQKSPSSTFPSPNIQSNAGECTPNTFNIRIQQGMILTTFSAQRNTFMLWYPFLLFLLQLVHWFDFIPCRGSSKWRYIKVTLLGQKIQDQVMRPSVWSFLSHSQSCPSLASWIC